jgi:hypothetical protein
LILRKLGCYPRQNSLALALREIGRIERTLFMLAWLEDPALLQQFSPLGWEHINLTGDYTWHTNKPVAQGGFRPLRTLETPPAVLSVHKFPFLEVPLLCEKIMLFPLESSHCELIHWLPVIRIK